jgi:hypothetical protein
MIMPHVADLQIEFKGRGVTFIAFTARDERNTEDEVAAFIKKRSPTPASLLHAQLRQQERMDKRPFAERVIAA